MLAGRKAIREQAPHLIWSTYPISTAHLIGRSLAAQRIAQDAAGDGRDEHEEQCAAQVPTRE
mgnify:CR=1 FL=1